jgi:hypothetical protein
MKNINVHSLLFRQKGRCYFCQKELSIHRADIEHLFARANGGPDTQENCVAVCKGANRLMADLSLKEKIDIFRDKFVCPEENGLSYIQSTAPELTMRVGEKADNYIGRLKNNKLSRPAKRNTLLNQLSNQYVLAQGEAEAIVSLFIEKGYLNFDGFKIIWHLNK